VLRVVQTLMAAQVITGGNGFAAFGKDGGPPAERADAAPEPAVAPLQTGIPPAKPAASFPKQPVPPRKL
jgi:hypothetical protein